MKGINFSHLHTWILFPVLLIVPFVVSSCQDDTEDQWGTDSLNPEKEFVISGHIEQECNTRATDLGFVDGDKMGVFIVDYVDGQPGKLEVHGNRTSNMRYKYDAAQNKWIPTKNIYWKDDKTSVDVYGYYPFKEVVSSVTEYPIVVAEDQNEPGKVGQMGGYEASDFLWAKSACVTPKTPVILEYHHLLAGVRVVLKEGTGFAQDEWNTLDKLVTVDNTVRKAQVNLAAGTVTGYGAYDKNIQMAVEKEGYRAVVIPQTVKAGKSLIGITLDGISYPFKKTEDMLYQGSLLHQYTIQVNKRTPSGDFELKLLDETITPWQNDESSHNFEGNSYIVVHVEKEGTLKQCLEKAHIDCAALKNLKLTGRLTDEDFDFIKEELINLASLNMKEVKLIQCHVEYYFEDEWMSRGQEKDDVLPNSAFSNMSFLRRLVLPDVLTEIGAKALSNLNLTSFLSIPNTVVRIGDHAFGDSQMSTALPDKLEYIGKWAFADSEIRMDLKLPTTLKIIDEGAFQRTRGLYGTISLPPFLEKIGSSAFWDCSGQFEGSLEIPQGITEIPDDAFGSFGRNFKKGTVLKLHDGVKKIGEGAFSGIKLNAPLYLPEGLTYIGEKAFEYAHFVGDVVLPSGLGGIGASAFQRSNLSGELIIPSQMELISGGFFSYDGGSFEGTQIEKLYLPPSVTVIQQGAFRDCANLREVFLGKFVNSIGGGAFAGCGGLSTFVCMAPEPPSLGEGCFDGVASNPLGMLLVPEAAVDLYRNTPGWNNFRFITPYHELACSLGEVITENKGIERKGILRSEGEWSVESCPDWCTVTPNSGGIKEKKVEITVQVQPLSVGAGTRSGDIVFCLKDKNFKIKTHVVQYDLNQPADKEIILQKASAGAREIPIFIVGEGFTAQDIIEGKYMETIKQQMEYFFAIEPYKTYRNYFTVSTAIACSSEQGIGTADKRIYNKFGTFDEWGRLQVDSYSVLRYVDDLSEVINWDNRNRSLVLMVCNTHRFASNTYHDWDGQTLSMVALSEDEYPYDQRGVIQHEVGGVGFGKLGSECISHFDFIQTCCCPGCNKLAEYYEGKRKGWYENLSLSGKMQDVPWQHLIFHPKYSGIVDLFEGGYDHARGVFRSEANSCMNSYIPYYNTISRESIVKRIMEYAGKPYSFEEFVNNDKIEIPTN